MHIAALVFWGVCVVADSPQFSAMSAENSPPEWLGSALVAWGVAAVWLLAPGPVLGLLALRPLLVRRSDVAEQRS